MKALFGAALAVLVAMTVIAVAMSPGPPAGKVRLVFTSDNNPLRKEQVELFNKLYPAYQVDLDTSNADMEKVIIQSLGGVGPDFFNTYTPFQTAAAVKSGVAWDITDELKKRGIDINDTWKALYPTCIYEGRVYGMPNNAAVNGIWFHKDLFDEAGIPYPKGPWTWRDMIPVAQKLTVRDGSGRVTRYGLLLDWKLNYQQFLMQWGARLYTPDGTRCVMDSPEGIAAFQFMDDLTNKYGIVPSAVEEETMAQAGGWGQGVITLFAGKKGAMGLGGRFWLCNLRSFPALKLGATECPYGARRVFRGYGKSTMINSQSPRREEALVWMDYQYGKPYNDLINAEADGVGPVKKYVESPDFLHDPVHPEEDYNAIWRDMMEAAEGDEVSLFVNGLITNRIVERQIDLIRRGQKTPEQGVRDAARQINAEIHDNLSRSPQLREQYDRLVARSAKEHG